MLNKLQAKASNPLASAWVSASAGTGKTKILTDRVIRLLLQGVEPKKILCLTFTNNAANEMHERILAKLQEFSLLTAGELAHQIKMITGDRATNKEIETAQNLFNNYLLQSDQVNIHTLHSYCQKILQKFPVEAGVPPNFQIIDEMEQKIAIWHSRRIIDTNKEYELINNFLIENFHQLTMDEIFADFINHRAKFANCQYKGLDFATLIEGFYLDTQQQYTHILQLPLIKSLVDANPTMEAVKNFFLTKEGLPRKRIVNSKIAKVGSSLYDELLNIQASIYQLDQEERDYYLEKFSEIMGALAQNFIRIYDEYKAGNAKLDYDDLIIKTRQLLSDSEARQWVLYKLDGGIDHILVDEAQDTSPDQWQIIEAIIQEFYANLAGEEQRHRTIFVVGDEKQSIFSFQGADVESFVSMNRLLKSRITRAQHSFENINLDVSYRSSKEIVEVVHQVFSRIKKDVAKDLFANIPQMKIHRSNHPGRVEIWPILYREEEEDFFWYRDDQQTGAADVKSKLALQIAEFIKQELSSGKVLAATNQPVSPGDFMILFRTRNDFTSQVIKQLQLMGLPVSGLDRIKLADEPLVQDMMSVAKFVLNPHDDLNLAGLLKSPFVNFTEAQVLEACINARGGNLYKPTTNEILEDFIFLYKNYSIQEFFNQICIYTNLRYRCLEIYDNGSLDVLDELLKLFASYCNNYDQSLEGFINWFETNDIEIKRENKDLDIIKIMTVHASKGLQAPYVILCDTTSLPTNSDRFVWHEDKGMLTSKDSHCVSEDFLNLKEGLKLKDFREYLRLLYVAMTRAEDNLIICGYSNKKNLPDNCWYNLIHAAMIQIGKEQGDGSIYYMLSNNQSMLATRIQKVQENLIEIKPYGGKNLDNILKQNTLEPATIGARDSIDYGLVMHKILEDIVGVLPLAEMSKHPLLKTLSGDYLKRGRNSIDLIANNNELSSLLATMKTRKEVTIGSMVIDDRMTVGRMDLLLEDKERFIVIDYKTDRNPPSTLEEVPEAYRKQLNFYASVLKDIKPDKEVGGYILWVENGQLICVC